MRARLLAEGIGTFMLVFAGTGAIVVDAASGGVIGHLGVAITFGLVVMAAIYSFGDLSGAHINPAVTLGFWLAGRFRAARVLPYMGAQCLGALAASALLAVLFPAARDLGATVPAAGAAQAFAMEVVLSFILMLVIIRTATGSRETGLMAGAAIGATVGLEALFAGPVSGASMNPARSLGPALVGAGVEHLWIYLLAPPAGMAFAVLAQRLLDRRESSQVAEVHQ